MEPIVDGPVPQIMDEFVERFFDVPVPSTFEGNGGCRESGRSLKFSKLCLVCGMNTRSCW